MHRRALAIKEAALGGEHPELAVTLANLATTLLDGRVARDHPTLALVRSRL